MLSHELTKSLHLVRVEHAKGQLWAYLAQNFADYNFEQDPDYAAAMAARAGGSASFLVSHLGSALAPVSILDEFNPRKRADGIVDPRGGWPNFPYRRFPVARCIPADERQRCSRRLLAP
jgi:hypothetical protein